VEAVHSQADASAQNPGNTFDSAQAEIARKRYERDLFATITASFRDRRQWNLLASPLQTYGYAVRLLSMTEAI
jgi:hypothetical protein